MNIFISTWVLLVAGLVFALPMVYMRVKDYTEASDEIVDILYVSRTALNRTQLTASPALGWRILIVHNVSPNEIVHESLAAPSVSDTRLSHYYVMTCCPVKGPMI